MTQFDFDPNAISDEQVNFIRKSVTDPKSRTTNTTQNFSGTGVQTEFQVTNATSFQFVNSVTVGGVAQVYGTDYTASFTGANRGKITFTTAPADGAAIVVDYDYGDSCIAYEGFPRFDLSRGSYPRIAVSYMFPSEAISASNMVLQTEARITIMVYGPNSTEINNLIKEIWDAYLPAYKSFYYLRVVWPVNVADMVPTEDKTGDMIAKAIELRAPFNIKKL